MLTLEYEIESHVQDSCLFKGLGTIYKIDMFDYNITFTIKYNSCVLFM